MNENLNLDKILKDCPKGTKLYCTFLGDVEFLSIIVNMIEIRYKGVTYTLLSNGAYTPDSKCVLFPSEYQRDWSKFKVPVKRFNLKEFKPFDKILVRDEGESKWRPSFLEKIVKEPLGGYSVIELITRCRWDMCVPYNEETEHLLWTRDDCPDYYKWWEN